MRKYYTQLDGLRGFAVLGVLVAHWIHLRPVMNLSTGNFGVNLFFVISGFLITEILYNDIDTGRSNKDILKKFYWRRMLRIFPIYYLVCFATYFANFYEGRELFWYNVSYTTNIHDTFVGVAESGAFTHIWSLCVEEQFYILWPAIILLTRNSKLNAILITIAIAIIIRAVMWYGSYDYGHVFSYRMTPSCFDAFGVGAFLAYTKKYRQAWLMKILSYKVVPFIMVAIYLLSSYVYVTDIMDMVFYRLIVSVISFYLIGYAVMYEHKKYLLLNNRIIKHIGVVSYGVYLYHMFLGKILEERVTSFLHSIGFIEQSVLKYNLYIIKFPLYTIITVLFATLSYKLFEVKILKYKTKLA